MTQRMRTVLVYNYNEKVIFKQTFPVSEDKDYRKTMQFAKSCGVTDSDNIQVFNGAWEICDCTIHSA